MGATDEGREEIYARVKQRVAEDLTPKVLTYDKLQGKWCRPTDNVPMGEIIPNQAMHDGDGDGKVIWDLTTHQHVPSSLTLVSSSLRLLSGDPSAMGDLKMELGRKVYWGRYQEGSPPHLIWSDGE